MASEPLSAPPETLVLGDSLRMRFEFAGYSSPDWLLEFSLVGPSQTTLHVDADGSGWLVTLDAESDDVEAGRYAWAIRMRSSDDSERATILSGQMLVTADPQEVTAPTDERSWARKMLEACEAALLVKGAATSFSVFGRAYTFATHSEMLDYRNRLRSEVDAEEEALRIERGEPSRSVAWARFS